MSRSPSSRREPPPRHSVTSSPVSSTCSPPGHVPSAWCTSEELGGLGEDVVEAAGLLAARGDEGVAVHRVAGPELAAPSSRSASTRGGSSSLTRSWPMREISVKSPGAVLGVEHVDETAQLVDAHRRADLQPERVGHPAQELHVRAVELAGAVADPQQVRRAVVPVAGERVAPGEGLLVGQDERFVARVEVHALQGAVVVEVDAAGLHELQRALDLVGDHLVALALERVGDELLVPRVHPRQARRSRRS